MKLRIILFVLILVVCLPLWADTWSDPSWKEMLSKSDIIGLFEVKEGNAFKARLVPVELYKGKLKDDHIWYTGYSNKFGPLDKLKPGEQYVLFLQSPKKYKSRFKSASGSASTTAEKLYKAYDFVRSQPNGYTAWTPTAGEVRIKNKKAYYTLSYTGFSSSHFHSKKENSLSSAMFIDFIKAYVQESKRAQFKERIVADINMNLAAASINDRLGEKIMMLYLLDNRKIYDFFMEVPHIDNMEIQFAMARQFEKLEGNRRKALELALLGSDYTMVRTEIINQIPADNPDIYGPLLIKQLQQASDTAFYANVMSPNQENRASELVSIIEKLKEMEYKEASPELLETMAITSDAYTFYTAANALDYFENSDYEDLVVERIINPNGISVYDLKNLIYKDRILAVKEPLMALIESEPEVEAKHAFQKQRDKLSAIECLSIFKGDTAVEQFMIDQLDHLTKDVSKRARRSTNEFIKKYMEGLTKLESQRAHKVIHQALFYWFSLNPDFSEERILTLKTESEKEIEAQLDNFIGTPDARKAYVRAYITNTGMLQQGIATTPKLIFIYKIQILNNKRSFNALTDVVAEEKIRLINEFGIEPDNLGFTTGRNLYGMDERFSMNIAFTFLGEYFEYAESFGTEADIKMLDLIEKHLLGSRDQADLRKLNETRVQLKKKLDTK